MKSKRPLREMPTYVIYHENMVIRKNQTFHTQDDDGHKYIKTKELFGFRKYELEELDLNETIYNDETYVSTCVNILNKLGDTAYYLSHNKPHVENMVKSMLSTWLIYLQSKLEPVFEPNDRFLDYCTYTKQQIQILQPCESIHKVLDDFINHLAFGTTTRVTSVTLLEAMSQDARAREHGDMFMENISSAEFIGCYDCFDSASCDACKEDEHEFYKMKTYVIMYHNIIYMHELCQNYIDEIEKKCGHLLLQYETKCNSRTR